MRTMTAGATLVLPRPDHDLAAQIIALSDPDLAEALDAYKKEMNRKVEQKAEKIRQEFESDNSQM